MNYLLAVKDREVISIAVSPSKEVTMSLAQQACSQWGVTRIHVVRLDSPTEFSVHTLRGDQDTGVDLYILPCAVNIMPMFGGCENAPN